MMEILPFLTSPMGCDLPMSLVLSCSPSLVLHIFRTRASVSIGLRISPRSFVGAFTLLKRRLVRLEYCSCSSILEPSLLILFVRLFIVWFCCCITVSCASTVVLVCSIVSM
jgi:hypothetical protein